MCNATIATENVPVTFKTVVLNEAGLLGLRVKVEKLNKRAERHGMNRLEVTIVSTFGFVPCFRRGFGESITLYNVEINGCAPRIDGWQLIARIEFNDTIGCVVRIAPGVDDDGSFASYRSHNGGCDHCNTVRRRNDVYVLSSDNGTRKVVGRNCLADFLRTGDAESFALYAEFACLVAEFDSAGCEDEGREGGWGGLYRASVELPKYLTVVAMLTRRLGWVSRSACKDNPSLFATAGHADNYFHPNPRDRKGYEKWIDENELYTSAGDAELAVRAIEWAKSVDSSKSEYLDVIRRIATVGTLDWKLDGYTASIIVAYQKDCERQAEFKAKRDGAKEKGWYGNVKDRVRGVTVRVVRVRYFETDFGTKTIVAMEMDLPDNRVAPITWFASGSHEFVEGAEYTMTATIKGHEDDTKWGKQTIVQRAKLEPKE